VHVRLSTEVERIDPESIVLRNSDGSSETIPNDAVFTMIGREAPLDFFRRSGLRIRGEWRARTWISLILFLALCTWLYHWKKGEVGLPIHDAFATRGWFPFNIGDPADPSTFLGTMTLASKSPGFWYSLVYCLCVVGFGVRRIRRRRTPYVTVQTVTLSLLQVIPLFLLPYLVLPWLGHNGWFDGGIGRTVADALFPVTEWDPQGREYWRTFGFVLAWPLFIWNVFTAQPMWTWLIISIVQTFVIIPLMIRRWGKGAYCGWICSCGALAETMGDAHRHKMPHGPGWNRANMIGQVFLLWVLFLLLLRVALWIHPVRAVGTVYTVLLAGGGAPAWLGEAARYLNYVWFVDVVWAGILGVGLYFWFSGRVWCRFACPLAALMHIYTRFSRFRILADKKKCISCNACTTVCHQGIDVMNFANKGRPMEDPECVRCSACVQTCPTGVLEFGRIDRRTGAVLGVDRLGASPVRAVELTVHGRATR
ncbi:MAG: 4Fe-4S binding protein, partial [Phycisphaerales bacterium]|nr:4Fe-4S binding protein [Phycisphaerales bacterium]